MSVTLDRIAHFPQVGSPVLYLPPELPARRAGPRFAWCTSSRLGIHHPKQLPVLIYSSRTSLGLLPTLRPHQYAIEVLKADLQGLDPEDWSPEERDD